METPLDYLEAMLRVLIYGLVAAWVIVILGRVAPGLARNANPAIRAGAGGLHSLGQRVEQALFWALKAAMSGLRALQASLRTISRLLAAGTESLTRGISFAFPTAILKRNFHTGRQAIRMMWDTLTRYLDIGLSPISKGTAELARLLKVLMAQAKSAILVPARSFMSSMATRLAHVGATVMRSIRRSAWQAFGWLQQFAQTLIHSLAWIGSTALRPPARAAGILWRLLGRVLAIASHGARSFSALVNRGLYTISGCVHGVLAGPSRAFLQAWKRVTSVLLDIGHRLTLALQSIQRGLASLAHTFAITFGRLQLQIRRSVQLFTTRLLAAVSTIAAIFGKAIGILAFLRIPLIGLWSIIQRLGHLASQRATWLGQGLVNSLRGIWARLKQPTGYVTSLILRVVHPLVQFFAVLALIIGRWLRLVAVGGSIVFRAVSTATMALLHPPARIAYRHVARPIDQGLRKVHQLIRFVDDDILPDYVLFRRIVLVGVALPAVILLGRAGAYRFTHVEIEFWTNDTKAEWVQAVTDAFNKRGYQVSSGKTIIVKVQQGDSGEFYPMVAKGEIRPTAWSPGETSWINDANLQWEQTHGNLLAPGPCPSVVETLIGVGMWQPMAEAMGWPDEPIGWDDIVELAADPEGWARYGHPEWGLFKFGHTHPGSSNTGFLAIASLAYSALDLREGMTPEMARSEQVLEAFRNVEEHTYHYGVSTRSLFTTMVERGPAYLHAGTNSEIGVMATNHYNEGNMRWPIVFIAPAGGAFWSDNPFCVLNASWVSDVEREAAEVYLDYLLASSAQRTAMAEWLRPVTTVAKPRPLPTEWQYTDISLSHEDVPPLASLSGDTQQAILDVFDTTKKPASILVLVDTSASMGGKKLKRAVEGIDGFVDLLLAQDEIAVYQFNTKVAELQAVVLGGEAQQPLRELLTSLKARGKTSLYDAVCQTIQDLEQMKQADHQADESRLYGIVLLSDGEDTASRRSFQEMFDCLPSGETPDEVKIFTIAYGNDADKALLEEIAQRTNGRFYTSDPENIEEIYRQIAFEQ